MDSFLTPPLDYFQWNDGPAKETSSAQLVVEKVDQQQHLRMAFNK